MYCTKCGNHVEDGNLFCTFCGTKFPEVQEGRTAQTAGNVQSPQSVKADVTNQTAQPQKGRSGKTLKKYLKWIIPGLALLVVGAVVLTVWLVHISKPAYKTRNAVEKTMKPGGLWDALDIVDLIKRDSGTIAAEFNFAQGRDVDQYLGKNLSDADRPYAGVKVTFDDSSTIRSDGLFRLPFAGLDISGTVFIDDEKIVISAPGLLSDNLQYTFGEDNDGVISKLFGKNYEDIQDMINSSSNTGSAKSDLIKGFGKVADLFWETLEKRGFTDIPETDLINGEYGYRVSLTGEDVTDYCSASLRIIDESIVKSGLKTSFDYILDPFKHGLDTNYWMNAIFEKICDVFDDHDYELVFEIKNDALSSLILRRDNSSMNSIFEVVFSDGEYPLQNFMALVDDRGIYVNGNTNQNGTETVSVSSVYRSPKQGIEEIDKLVSWAYNKSTGEFAVEAGDTSWGYHRANIDSTDVDGIIIKGVIGSGSSEKTINCNEIAVYNDDSEVLVIDGKITVSDKVNVKEIKGNTVDIGSAGQSDFSVLLEGINSMTSGHADLAYEVEKNLGIQGGLSESDGYTSTADGVDDVFASGSESSDKTSATGNQSINSRPKLRDGYDVLAEGGGLDADENDVVTDEKTSGKTSGKQNSAPKAKDPGKDNGKDSTVKNTPDQGTGVTNKDNVKEEKAKEEKATSNKSDDFDEDDYDDEDYDYDFDFDDDDYDEEDDDYDDDDYDFDFGDDLEDDDYEYDDDDVADFDFGDDDTLIYDDDDYEIVEVYEG